MLPRFSAILAALVMTVAVASTAEACSRNVPSAAKQTLVPGGRINQQLLDAAARAEVNYHRCRAGLPPLGAAGAGLITQAGKHSKWMARTKNLSHQSSVRGLSTLKQRVRAAGVPARYGAENLGMVHRYQIDDRRIKIVSARRCQFATRGGKVLPAHTYASLARYQVQRWMKSPGHRKNIMNPNVKRVSTAAAFDSRAKYCGLFWVTQKFVG